ncbi:hypothetical protein ACWD5R_39130 [Streptomyces sp. NPDC002514]|uniref:hypothetical protein n=1 Tax=unclassified Streptomyces TaxID=2593676 RepID=UPI003697CAEB
MYVVVLLELAERAVEVVLVPDQGPVGEFVAAGLDPALHDGVHAWHPGAGEDDLEDVLQLPDGTPATSNAELIRVAHAMIQAFGQLP